MMHTIKSTDARCRHGGFTLMEAMIVSALMVFLAALLSMAWSGMGRPLVDAIARSRVAQEATLALTSIARDWGGNLADASGDQGQGRLVGRMVVGGSELRLCFDGSASPNGLPDWGPPDTVIIYEVQSAKLLREDQNAGTIFTVAENV